MPKHIFFPLRRILVAVLIGLALCAAADGAVGSQKAENPPKKDPRLSLTSGPDGQPLPPAQGCWRTVLAFRRLAAVEGGRAFEKFAASKEIIRKIDSLGRSLWGSMEPDPGWSHFFALSLFTLAGPEGAAPDACFYNPYADVWVLTRWKRTKQMSAIALADLEVVTGEWVRRAGQPPLDYRPLWLAKERYRPAALARSAVESIRSMEKLTGIPAEPDWRSKLWQGPPELAQLDLQAASINLMKAFLRSRQLLKTDPDEKIIGRIQQQVVRFVASGSEGEMARTIAAADRTSPDTAKLMADLPSDVYTTLAPAYWLADEKAAMAFLVPHRNADFCISLTMARKGQDLKLVRVDLISFSGAYAAEMAKEL